MARLPKRKMTGKKKKKWKPNWPGTKHTMDNWLCTANNSSSHNTLTFNKNQHIHIHASLNSKKRVLAFLEFAVLFVFCCISANSFICTTAFSSEKLYNFIIDSQFEALFFLTELTGTDRKEKVLAN